MSMQIIELNLALFSPVLPYQDMFYLTRRISNKYIEVFSLFESRFKENQMINNINVF